MAGNDAFFVRGDDGVEYGPVDLAELREWVTENRVGLGTSVRIEDSDGAWHPWQHYPELVALLAEVHVTGALLPTALPILAPFGRRALAFFVDLIVSFAIIVVLWLTIYSMLPPELIARLMTYTQTVLQGLTPAGPVPVLPRWFEIWANVILIGVPTLYYSAFHAAVGRTPAKFIMQIQVVDGQGRKPAIGKAVIRAFVFAVCVYFFYGIPLFYAFFNPQRRALHDLVAGTYVVET